MNGMSQSTHEKKSFSIKHFCATHGISRATFYNLVKKQLAPRLMKVGKRTLISAEAAAEWRARMEQEVKQMFTSQQKIYPDYFFQIKNRPHANPIFITADWSCLRFIMSHRGICLFCNQKYTISSFDFSFCFNREIWIPYSYQNNFFPSMQLGQGIQLAAASKVLVIQLSRKLLEESENEQ